MTLEVVCVYFSCFLEVYYYFIIVNIHAYICIFGFFFRLRTSPYVKSELGDYLYVPCVLYFCLYVFVIVI